MSRQASPVDSTRKVGDLMAARPLIRAESRDAMAKALWQAYAVRDVDFASDEVPFEALANRAQLPEVQLHYCRYDTASSIGFADMSGFRQMFNLGGAGELRVGGRDLPIDPTASAIIPPNADFTGVYGGGYSHLVVQFDEAALRRKWAFLTGGDLDRLPDLPVLRTLPAARIANTRAVALVLAGQFSGAHPISPIAVAELSQALITTFLQEYGLDPEADMRQALAASPAAAARLVDYIQANWRHPLTVESIAAACDVSVRSVFAQFKQRFGIAPMAYLRNVRLDQARLSLSADPTQSVIDVAMACGFHSLGHFARRYRERFGELPSDTLQDGFKRRLEARSRN